MVTDPAGAAAVLLWGHWQAGSRVASLPVALRPETRADGYAIQRELVAIDGGPLVGWKIAATSAAGQAHIAVDGPLAGRLLASRAFAPGASLDLRGNGMRVAELEFAFRMGRGLEPRAARYEVDEVIDAVAALHPAIEVPDSRFEPFELAGGPQLLADNACAHEFVLGDAAPESWRALDLAGHAVRGEGAGIDVEGTGRNVLGDPRIALAWLVNELSGLGIPLASGMVVSTGTCVTPIAVSPGDRVRGDFGVLGAVDVRFLYQSTRSSADS